MNQDDQKRRVAQAAVDYVSEHITPTMILGIGTGSTANHFIDILSTIRERVHATVASSNASKERLQLLGFTVLDMNEVEHIGIYVDGADEADPKLQLIKGGGGALTREKIVANAAETFVCICDGTKLKETLGEYPLPVEVIPMAVKSVSRKLQAMYAGVKVVLRVDEEGKPFVSDNGANIVDLHNFLIPNPLEVERDINAIAGVVTVGLFAARGADLLLVANSKGEVTTSTAADPVAFQK